MTLPCGHTTNPTLHLNSHWPFVQVAVPLFEGVGDGQSAAVQQLAVGMQAPLHSLKPVSHAKPQVPLLQTGWAFAMAVVQVTQSTPPVPHAVVLFPD